MIIKYMPLPEYLAEMDTNIACMGCWLESIEYDLKDAIGERKYRILVGFWESLRSDFKQIQEILNNDDMPF